MHSIEARLQPEDVQANDGGTHVIDGNALLHALCRLPGTFQELAQYILCSLPKTDIVHFVTDTYVENSIKQLERARRGSAPAYIIGGGKTRLPRDFKSFLLNADKRQLIAFLLSEWQTDRYAKNLHGREVFYVCESQCVRLHSNDGLHVTSSPIEELTSNQKEADTRIILHCLYSADRTLLDVDITVRSPDTDVFILLIAYSNRIHQPLMFDTGSGNNK
jgi:hypothetical protein